MKNMKLNAIALAVTTTLGLVACNDTGSGSASNNQAIVAAKSTTGVITGFGSVFINGVEYDTTGTTVEKDGATGLDESVLKVGMVVTLDGSVNADGTTGSAAAIKFSDEVEGLLLANNIAGGVGTIDVMGKTVSVDADTVFEDDRNNPATPFVDLASVPLNERLEISGFSNGSGNIYATRVSVKDLSDSEDMEVKGIVASLDSVNKTFMIGTTLTIDYSGATEVPAGLADGLYVEVKSSAAPSGSTLLASKVELKDGGKKAEDGDDGEDKELEGVVTAELYTDQADSLDKIEVNGQPVVINNDTEYDEGASAAGLVLGAKIKMEGSYDNGNLMAKEIKFKQSGDIELDAYVDAIDAANKTVTIMGQTISVPSTTTMNDERDQGGNTPERYFDVSDLASGDWVELKLFKDSATGGLIATKLIRDDIESTPKPVTLEGKVESLPANGTMVVSGFTITIPSTLTLPQGLAVDMKLEISGTYANGMFTADSVGG